MHTRLILLIAVLASIFSSAMAKDRYVGGDISLLPEYEKAGAKYYDHDGKPIAQLLPWCREQGMNAMRVRLFINPKDYKGSDADPNACQDLGYIIPLCNQIKQAGLALMLDFHYSDTWADPAKQWTPAAWGNLTDEQLYQKIYDYTRTSLDTLKSHGITPDFIQPGNEISFGMLWGTVGTPEAQLKKTFIGSEANWKRLGNLLNQAIKACREICPAARIVIHTERVAQPDVLTNFYDQMKKLGVDYDIIGLSYYPYFHGKMPVLTAALTRLTTRFPEKEIMIVETGYPYAWEVPGTDQKVDYPYTEEGQNTFARALVNELLKFDNVTGLFWWWMEYNAKDTDLAGWYNAPLFDSRTGRVTLAFKTLCSFATGHGSIDSILPDAEAVSSHPWYDLLGRPVKAPSHGTIYISPDGKKLKY